MTTGRFRPNDIRVFIDGYDMSGHARSVGELGCTFDEGIDDALSNSIKAVVVGNATVSAGPVNGLYDNTASTGLHIVMNGAGVKRTAMFPWGCQAAPANNDPVFAGQFLQGAYIGNADSAPVMATIPLASVHGTGTSMAYARPWGVLIHANAAATAVNSAVGIDQSAQTTKGGFMCYQVTAGNGTAAIIVEDADVNNDGSFGTLLTSGTIDCSSPVANIVALNRDATVERYIRWQIALGTATTVTFALSWHRGL